LSQDVIQKWTPLILRRPGLVAPDSEPYRNLLRLAWQKGPDLALEKISQAIDEQNQDASDNELPQLDMQIQECWDHQIEMILVDKLKNGGLKPGFVYCFWEILLAKGSELAQQWGIQQLKGPVPSDLASQTIQLRMALSLLFAEDNSWPITWNRITALAALQDSLAHTAVNHLYYEFDQGRLTTLPALLLGEICLWLIQAFPESMLPRTAGRTGPRDITGVFRGRLFNYLQTAGTPEAIQTLQFLTHRHPDDTGLKWMLAEAQQALLRHTWIPPEPATILAMARRSDTRFMDSGEQLLSIIMEPLGRFQQRLHGHSPRIDSLWNKRTDTKKVNHWQPVDESSLSNSVKFHLEDDLQGRDIILNREVEIRRS